MRYFKHAGTGEVFAYSQADIDTVNRISELESNLLQAQAFFASLPAPVEDSEESELEAYESAQIAVSEAQSEIDAVLPVFFDIREKLKTLTEMTPEDIDAHLNPPPGPVPVPQQVTRAQGKAALISAGLWQNVLDYVEDITDPTKKSLSDVALNDTSHWRRDSPFLNEAAQEIGLTGEQLDDLFRQAAEILL